MFEYWQVNHFMELKKWISIKSIWETELISNGENILLKGEETVVLA